jgi:Ca2+-binding EF-hand superfamily protein
MEIKQEHVKEFLKLFSKMEGAKTGYLLKPSFKNLLQNDNANNESICNDLFNEFDYNGAKSISFREFLIASAVMNKMCGKDADDMAARLVYNVISSRSTLKNDKSKMQNRLAVVIKDEKKAEALFTECSKGSTVYQSDFIAAIIKNHNGVLNDFVEGFQMKVTVTPGKAKEDD